MQDAQLNTSTISSGDPFTLQGISRCFTSGSFNAGGNSAYGSFSRALSSSLRGVPTMVEAGEAIVVLLSGERAALAGGEARTKIDRRSANGHGQRKASIRRTAQTRRSGGKFGGIMRRKKEKTGKDDVASCFSRRSHCYWR
jgi:hypothetical protein